MLAIVIMLIVLVLLALPFLPIRLPFTLFWFNFPEEKRPKNIFYIASTLVVILLTLLLMPYILKLAAWFRQLRLVVWLCSLVPNHALYSAEIFGAVFANVFFCILVLLACWVTGTLLGLFPKFSPAALKEMLKKAKEKRAEKKKQKKDQPDPNQPDPNQPDPNQPQSAADPQALPDELMPEPEPPDQDSRFVLQSSQSKKTVTRKSGKKTVVQEPENTQEPSPFKKWLLQMFSLFYVRGKDGWYVQPQCKKAAKHLRNFVILTGVAYLVIFTLLMIPIFFKVRQYADTFYQLMSKLVDSCYLYPSVSLVLLTQIFWFMNGRLPEEPVDELSYNIAKRNGVVVDLDELEEQLVQSTNQAFEIKSFYSGDVEGQERARLPVDASDDTVLQAILRFVESQKLVRNDDYLRGIQALQRGEDTLFDAPLFTSASMYLYPYLNIRISRGERMLVICQSEEDIPNVIDNLKKGFCLVQRTHECIWNIADRKGLDADNNTDILVLTPKDFLDERLFVEAERFFRHVTIALLPDADRVVMSNNYLCVIIAERLKQAAQSRKEHRRTDSEETNIQYLFLSTRHTLNLAQSLTEYFLLEQDVTCVQAEYAYGNVRLYVWREKGKGRPLLDNEAQEVKLESMIAEIAGRNNVPNISVFTDVAIFANQIDPVWLNTYDVFDRPIGFTVVSDDSYNLPGTIYTYSRYIGKQISVLHVISKPYMLRDFFYDSAIRSLYERPLMERGMVEHARLKQTNAVLLLCRLMKGIPVAEFAAKMAEISEEASAERQTYPELRKLVDSCLTMAFGRESTAEEYGFQRMDRLDDSFATVPYIRIREEGILEHLMKDAELVRVKISRGGDYKVLPLFRRMLAQKHLPGQHMVIDHKNYQINDINFDAGIIYATPAKSVHNVPDQYIQVREYTLKNSDAFCACCKQGAENEQGELPTTIDSTRLDIQGVGKLTGVTMVRGTGALAIDSHTISYYDSTEYRGQLDLAKGSVFSVQKDLHRTVENALYLRFDGEFAGDDSLTMTLAILLQEMMKTMFPDQYFCISVCPILKDLDNIYQHKDLLSRRIAGLYPRLNGWDQPAENAIELLIVDDCEGGTGVLDILFQPEAVYMSNILDMLCEYLDWLKEHPDGAYLNYGADQTPALYQFDRVREILDAFYKGYQREHDLYGMMDESDRGRCKFCDKKLVTGESFVWKGKYNICAECEEEMIPDEAQAGQILQYICRFLSENFGEDMGDLSVSFDATVDLSGVDVGAGKILLAPDLPLTATHCHLLTQTVRLWQLNTLPMSGEPEFDGQLLYVLLQYLEELKQYQHRKRLHGRALLGKSDGAIGYCSLRQALQIEKHDNSFKYMREHFTGNKKTPVPPPPNPRFSTKVDPSRLTYFNREGLEENEKLYYDLLLQGLMESAKEIDVSAAQLPGSESERLWKCVTNDHPELHWVNPYKCPGRTPETGTIQKVYPHYWIDAQEKDKRQKEIEQVIPEYMEGITEDSGDYDIALQLYINIARQMDYDSLGLDRQKSEDDADKVDDLRNIYGALVLKRPVCAGYAFAYQYLLQRLGVQAIKVSGGCHEGGRHAWNIVKLEGNCYHVDVTWGDGSNTDPSKSVAEPCFGYFCLTDQEIGQTRSIDAVPPAPSCTAVSCNYFVRNGLFFHAYDHKAAVGRIAELLQEPARRRVDLRFGSYRVLEVANEQLVRNGGITELLRATGRSGIDYYRKDTKLNILTFFFQPLQKNENPIKPEESN